MRHDYGNSICVTTQVGCRIGCTFCASTLGGLKRNLQAGEIVAQVVKVQKALDETNERVSSIVVMGIGEPFDNYDELIKFLKIVNHPKGLHIGARHITVSTSGIIPKIYKFADENMQINFAISLHAPNTELRSKLMPINRAYKLPELMEAVRYYIEKTGRRVTFEYGLFGGVNDQIEHAEELAELIKGLKCHVNLIPVNYVPERNYVRTPREQIFAFEKTLKNMVLMLRFVASKDTILMLHADSCAQKNEKRKRKRKMWQHLYEGRKRYSCECRACMKAVFQTDVGKIRSHNEDNGGVFINQAGNYLAVVADGMGGISLATWRVK